MFKSRLISSSRFLSMLEEEVYSHSSPIWSLEFLAGTTGGQIPVQTGRKNYLYPTIFS